ncbi:MAG: hypothetical protein ABIK90_07380 [candidate division WOR-3 bacterium]
MNNENNGYSQLVNDLLVTPTEKKEVPKPHEDEEALEKAMEILKKNLEIAKTAIAAQRATTSPEQKKALEVVIGNYLAGIIEDFIEILRKIPELADFIEIALRRLNKKAKTPKEAVVLDKAASMLEPNQKESPSSLIKEGLTQPNQTPPPEPSGNARLYINNTPPSSPTSAGKI